MPFIGMLKGKRGTKLELRRRSGLAGVEYPLSAPEFLSSFLRELLGEVLENVRRVRHRRLLLWRICNLSLSSELGPLARRTPRWDSSGRVKKFSGSRGN
jgi:hypothetical protein